MKKLKIYLQICILKIQIIKLNTLYENLCFQFQILEEINFICLTKRDIVNNQLAVAKQNLKKQKYYNKLFNKLDREYQVYIDEKTGEYHLKKSLFPMSEDYFL